MTHHKQKRPPRREGLGDGTDRLFLVLIQSDSTGLARQGKPTSHVAFPTWSRENPARLWVVNNLATPRIQNE